MKTKSQSYFLLILQENNLIFKISSRRISKQETREIAKNIDLNVTEKPDSQDICFVPNGDYVSVIEKFRPDSFKRQYKIPKEIIGSTQMV